MHFYIVHVVKRFASIMSELFAGGPDTGYEADVSDSPDSQTGGRSDGYGARLRNVGMHLPIQLIYALMLFECQSRFCAEHGTLGALL